MYRYNGVRARLCIAAAIALMTIFVPRAGAHRVKPLTLDQLVEQSSAIVTATALLVDPRAGARRGDCATAVTLQIDEVLGGTVPSQGPITFELPVGYVEDGTQWRVPGLPAFEQGQRYLLFLAAGAWRTTPITNVSQGFLRLVEVAGRQHYVNEQGLVLERITTDGFVFGARLGVPSTDGLIPGAPVHESLGEDIGPVLPDVAAERARTAVAAAQLRSEIKRAIAASTIDRESRALVLKSSIVRKGRP